MTSLHPSLSTIAGAPSWTFRSDRVEAALTRQGGHLAPVRFQTKRGMIEPFAIAPWAEEDLPPDMPPILRVLRGDFFCAPFGGDPDSRKHRRLPIHGQPANATWSAAKVHHTPSGTEFVARLRTTLPPGTVTKRILLRPGETNVYCAHELRGFSGPMCIGHHAMLAFPPENGPGQIMLSPWREGHVCPRPFENPETGGYSSLRTGAAFRSLERVPFATGGTTDLTSYPARPGFEDLVMVSARHASRLAWTTATFPEAGFLWFALKDPQSLASTVLWHSNGGRHYPPWNGRHRGVLGLEEVTSYFHFGLTASAAPNPLSRAGVPTALRLRSDHTLTVPYVMGVAALPRGFDRLASVRIRKDHLVFSSRAGATVRHPVDVTFLSRRA